ncbi:uncharacterized protein BO95DRAFT_126808 [Aspergillus brunneoviolaceus CBS 621.78]|uniref:Uncharacterized protein n=1 Tax=Aspergillus brunneoviolaceus CBS 621.78 TaxID=1450534 RepID=A0ACD1G9K6_9EURO|nr:hypothetical protein BO95DRAFT_126808 [Aspergillus brunneoviolaceus CBS 621.78]RAH45920.1 hypothetical protein BO95DRAFT_126808 [Aspergillus brunneoviolaceus CBS 621.78]
MDMEAPRPRAALRCLVVGTFIPVPLNQDENKENASPGAGFPANRDMEDRVLTRSQVLYSTRDFVPVTTSRYGVVFLFFSFFLFFVWCRLQTVWYYNHCSIATHPMLAGLIVLLPGNDLECATFAALCQLTRSGAEVEGIAAVPMDPPETT